MGPMAYTRQLLARCALLIIVLLAAHGRGPAQGGVDYAAEVQPIFEVHCGCHQGVSESGVDLSSYEKTLGSIGTLYGRPVVVPFDASTSPLWLQVALAEPELGRRMPPFGESLEPGQIDTIARWIDEGARESPRSLLRGDADGSGAIDLADVVHILQFLFRGGAAPPCSPLADTNADGRLDVSDAVRLLGFLFLGGPRPAALTAEEEAACRSAAR
jgi:hypothetical protein